MDLTPGRRILDGRWELLRELGRGATGRVWEARHAQDGRVIAVKCMPVAQGGRAAAEREAEVAVRVRHPAIVRVLLTDEEGDLALVAMERCEGSLATRIVHDGPLTAAEACAAMAPVLDALAAAHAVGVVHRDVKPANVLVRPDGGTALGDWGIARALFGGGGATTSSLALVGTLPYLAPELRRDVRAASPASDVYAAGVCLASLCLGQPPDDPCVPAGEARLRAALPAHLAAIVLRACAWDPAERYASAGEMAAALRAARTDAVEAPRATGSPPTPTTAPRSRTPVLLAVAGALIAVAAFAGARVREEAAPAPDDTLAALPACPQVLRDLAPVAHLAPVETVAASVGDLDEDGFLDVVYSNQGAGSLTLWWGRAGGLPSEAQTLEVGRVSGQVAIVDVDADGNLDLVVPHRDEARFSVWSGHRGRRFSGGGSVVQAPAPGNVQAVQAARSAPGSAALLFDADGLLLRRDAVGGRWEPHRALGTRQETIPNLARWTSAGHEWVARRADGRWVADSIDDEGSRRVDLPQALAGARRMVPWFEGGVAVAAAALREGTLVRVDVTDGGGAPTATACRASAPLVPDPSLEAVADLDGDGTVDLVMSETCSGCTSNHVFARGVR